MLRNPRFSNFFLVNTSVFHGAYAYASLKTRKFSIPITYVPLKTSIVFGILPGDLLKFYSSLQCDKRARHNQLNNLLFTMQAFNYDLKVHLEQSGLKNKRARTTSTNSMTSHGLFLTFRDNFKNRVMEKNANIPRKYKRFIFKLWMFPRLKVFSRSPFRGFAIAHWTCTGNLQSTNDFWQILNLPYFTLIRNPKSEHHFH